MKVVGLSGGIATGKSTVSSTLERERVPIVDCDKIAHAVVKKDRWGYKRVISAFGTDILQSNGELDRAALGAIVFSDPAARKRLNKATHLPVFLETLRQLAVCWLRFEPLAIVDMPLLFETNSHKLAGTNILVACGAEDQAEAKVAAQMPLEQKRRLCDLVIDNCGTPEQTRRQALQVLHALRRHSLLHQIFLGPGALCALVAGLARLFSWLRG